MPRKAGSGANYSWVLLDKSTGKYDPSSTIDLPSVTTIIGAVLNKPFLVQWAYAHTRDVISGAVSEMNQSSLYKPTEMIEMLGDAEELEEFLKANKLRPNDIKDIRGDEGTEAHKALETLAGIALDEGSDDALQAAESLLAHPQSTGYERATADWWLQRKPEVIASEMVLHSLRHRFSGTVDLIWNYHLGDRLEPLLTVTDLKSRRKDLGMYDSDDVQTGAYGVCYTEMTGWSVDRRTVLLVHDDGTWKEEEARLPAEAFLHLRELYSLLKEA